MKLNEIIKKAINEKELESMKENGNNFVQLDNRIFLILCQLGISATIVYIGIRRHLNDKTHRCFPSNRLLQKELNLSDKTITKAIKLLREVGLIKVKVGKGGCYNYIFPELKALVKDIEPADLESSKNENNIEEFEEDEYYEEVNWL